jgi:hypothetical protein
VWLVQDEASRNGTKLNDTVLLPRTPEALYDGDTLHFGLDSDPVGSGAMVFTVVGMGRLREADVPRSTEFESTESRTAMPLPTFPASTRKYTDRVLACLREGLAAIEHARGLNDIETIQAATGKVVQGLRRIGEVYINEQRRCSRDHTRTTLKFIRHQVRHDKHDPVVGTSTARKRRGKARGNKHIKRKNKDLGVRFTVTGISKSQHA